MADEMVLEVQKWLNNTYSGVEGYERVNEDGYTGWGTVYGLIEGLQHELGISPVVANFGATTSAYYDQQITPNWGPNLPTNVIKLIQGAFWCKGMPQGVGPGAFDGVYSSALANAVIDLKTQAGFNGGTAVLDAKWAKALFDMAQFVLIGDSRVREMQQYLNLHYSDYTGILPTDGVYQRATNSAIVYGIQAELGLSVSEATGTFGPTTSSLYQQAYQSGLSSNLIMLVQFALYANMREFWESGGASPIAFTGVLDSATRAALQEFQIFMQLSPVDSGSPDLRTVLSLVQSNGDTSRSFKGIDTSLQLTNQQITDLKNYGIGYVGRYLTGTVGNDFIPKNLTRDEAENILSAGMNIIPIYQDNYPSALYYNYLQGISDGYTALLAAAHLGIPSGSFIYFAVDFDALDSQIDNGVIDYFEGVKERLSGNQYGFQYQVGVYGTRNVCTRVSEALGIKRSYVANMSSGWSGNLGFSQPLNWAFDQFYEGSYASVSALDHVAVSGLDEGVSYLEEATIDENYWLRGTGLEFIAENTSITLDGPEVTLQDWRVLKVEARTYSTVQYPGSNTINLDIRSGELSTDSSEYLKELFGADVGTAIVSEVDKLAVGMSTAQLSIYVLIDEELRKGFRITINFPETSTEDFKVVTSVEFDITFDFNISTGVPVLDTAMQSIFKVLLGAAFAALCIVALVIFISIAPELAAGTALASLGAILLNAIGIFGGARKKK